MVATFPQRAREHLEGPRSSPRQSSQRSWSGLPQQCFIVVGNEMRGAGWDLEGGVMAKWGLAAAVISGTLLAASSADAQQHTFHLDRLEVPGAPEDGLVLFRPVTQPNAILYAQLALGFAVNPLRTRDITDQIAVLRASPGNLITTQLSTSMSAGFELLDRLTLGVTLPIAWEQSGNQPVYPQAQFGGAAYTSVSTTGPADAVM